jgi:trigger factor
MQTTVETLGQLERRVNVAVPIAHIEGEVQKRLARLAKTVKLPGFRPGHVPLKMVAQQYGPQLRSEVISDAVQTEFRRRDQRAEPACRRLPPHRAAHRR